MLTLPIRKWIGEGASCEEPPTILFLHGFLGSAEDAQTLYRALHKKYTVIAVDLPGHGRCRGELMQQAYTMEETAQMVVEAVRQEDTRKLLLYGYSMGARLGLYLCIYYPQYFSMAVLESGSPGLATSEERAKRREIDSERAQRIRRQGVSSFVKTWYEMPLFAGLRKADTFAEVYGRRLDNNPEGLACSLKGMGTGEQPSLWDKLADISMPIRLAVGGDDAKFVSIAETMAALSPQIELCIIPDTGHCFYLERPELLPTICRFE